MGAFTMERFMWSKYAKELKLGCKLEIEKKKVKGRNMAVRNILGW